MKGEKSKRIFKTVLYAIPLICCFASCKNHKNPEKTFSKIFIVRHGERYPGFNGHLSWYGRLRAGDLMRRLQDSGIEKIYVTPFSRTTEMADSLILQRKIDTSVYRLDTIATELIAQIKNNRDFGRTILIVGSSVMIPDIIKKLGGTYDNQALPDSAFNVLFELINDHGQVQLSSSTYGRPNLPITSPNSSAADTALTIKP